MGARLRIGLTGGIASGKTTVAKRFIELGVPVIDADEVARALVAPGTQGLQQVIDRFGPGILSIHGELDRRALRELVFADVALRRDLEVILHPLIRRAMEQRAVAADGPYVVMAIPLLVEGGSLDRVDRILVIDVDEAVQLERVMARDGSSLDQARAILAAQCTREARLKQADDVLINTGGVIELRHGIDRLHGQYLHLAEMKRSDGDLTQT